MTAPIQRLRDQMLMVIDSSSEGLAPCPPAPSSPGSRVVPKESEANATCCAGERI